MTSTDAELVKRAVAGDDVAFEALVRRHYDAAYAVALSRVGRPADAEDVCQDAFLRALRGLEGCRHPDRFRGWLLRIVRNTAENARRDRTLREGPSLEQVPPASDRRQDPARDAERAELRERLLTAMEALTETQREVLLLHDAEGWRHAEIGELLGVSEGAARVQLHRARRALRERLRGTDPA